VNCSHRQLGFGRHAGSLSPGMHRVGTENCDEAGVLRLPGVDEYELGTAVPEQRPYEHEPPWRPERIVDDTLELDEDEPDIDPDDITWDNEFDGENEDT